MKYSQRHWIEYPDKASIAGLASLGILCQLYLFIHSTDLKNWLLRDDDDSDDPDFEYRILGVNMDQSGCRAIHNYLRKLMWLLYTEEISKRKENNLQNAAITWGKTLMRTREDLEDYVGKQCCKVWLYDDLVEVRTIFIFFRLALKYYCKTTGRCVESVRCVQDVAIYDFTSMKIWVNQEAKSILSRRDCCLFFASLLEQVN